MTLTPEVNIKLLASNKLTLLGSRLSYGDLPFLSDIKH